MDQHGLKYIIRTSSPDECRQEIVNWLRGQAIIHSTKARIARLKKTQLRETVQASTYNEAANFIERIVIEYPMSMRLK